MAQPINCDNQCGTLAQIMWTEIDNGNVQAYCAPCLAEICLAVAQQAGMIEPLILVRLSKMEADKVIRYVKPKTPPAAPAAEQQPVEESAMIAEAFAAGQAGEAE